MNSASVDQPERLRHKFLLVVVVLHFFGYVLFSASISVALENESLHTAAAPQMKPPPIGVNFSGGLLSVSAKDADIRDLVAAIAAASGVKIVLDKSITGKATADVKDLKFEAGLKKVLKDVVEGGYSAEYLKTNGTEGLLILSKVTIARLGKGAGELQDMQFISDITVQDAIGKEIAFARWGAGAGEIPLMINKIDDRTVRVGFYMMRVGEDGSLYFVHFGHNKVYVYDKDGNAKQTIPFSGRISQIDVDHEGNLYLIEATEGSRDHIGKVLILDSEGKKIDFVTLPPDQASFTGNAVIDDGILKDGTATGEIYDFRKYLKYQDKHSARKRYWGGMKASNTSVMEDDRRIGTELVVWGVDSIGLPKKFIKSSFPEEWSSGDDGPNVLGAYPGHGDHLVRPHGYQQSERSDAGRFLIA